MVKFNWSSPIFCRRGTIVLNTVAWPSITWYYTYRAAIANANVVQRFYVNSLAPGWCFRNDLKNVISKLIWQIDIMSISCEIVLVWMSIESIDDKSTLDQVLAWCCQATSHYLSQCWPRSMASYCVTRPQWVKCKETPCQYILSFWMSYWVSVG